LSVSKNRAIDTHLASETQARWRFISLYLVFVILLVGLVAYFYYKSQEQIMFSTQRIHLMEYASEQSRKLKQLHRHYPHERVYPRDDRFNSAIYDLEHKKIFSTLLGQSISLDDVIYSSDEMIHFVRVLDDYYLGAKYLIIEVPSDSGWYQSIVQTILIYTIPILAILILIGVYLSRLFVSPMRNSIMLLDRFIKDTTHELNTPLSAILANIEMINVGSMDSANAKRLKRIEIGARTVSTLYEDLKFLTLERQKPISDEVLDLMPLVESRLEYFAVLMQSKHITLTKDMSSTEIVADRRLITRVIDNLLSNAIKYNRRGGTIDVRLHANTLTIEDSGIGIPKDELSSVFKRYVRFNDSEGGFGIGLNIVKQIIDYYSIKIEIDSEPNIGTKVVLRWV